MAEPRYLEQLQDLIKRSELPTAQKLFWLEKLPLLPEVLSDQLQRTLTRIEILQIEKKVLHALSSLPLEKMFDTDAQQRALLKLREVEQRKYDLRRAAEVNERLKAASNDAP